MLEKLKAQGANLKLAAIKYGPAVTALMLTGSQIVSNAVMAEADAKGLAKTILEIVANLIIALGIFIAVLGVVNFASAHAEGNGGSQDKAVKQIAAGVMVVALSVILKSKSGDLANYITTT